MSARLYWLALRRRLFWWCMHPSCWRRSVVSTIRGGRRRGNVCVVHLMQAIMGMEGRP